MMKNLQEEADYLALKDTKQNEFFLMSQGSTFNQPSESSVFIKPVKILSPDEKETSFAEAKVQDEEITDLSHCDSSKLFSSIGCGFKLESDSAKDDLTLRQVPARTHTEEDEPPFMRQSIHSLAFSIRVPEEAATHEEEVRQKPSVFVQSPSCHKSPMKRLPFHEHTSPIPVFQKPQTCETSVIEAAAEEEHILNITVRKEEEEEEVQEQEELVSTIKKLPKLTIQVTQ